MTRLSLVLSDLTHGGQIDHVEVAYIAAALALLIVAASIAATGAR